MYQKQIISVKYIATFLLVLMCVQYIPLEGYGVSYVKFGAMCLTPLIWLLYSPKFSDVFVWAGLYFLTILFSGLFNIESFRLSTLGYAFTFVVMFITYYNLVYCERAFSVDYFMRLLKSLILAYSICLILQQLVRLSGVESMPIINLVRADVRGSLIGNSLAIEQSHSARILTAFFLALLRMYEVKWGKSSVTINSIYADAKWVVLGFLWSMITMGSGTAFVGLAALSLYFIKRQYMFVIVPLLIGFYFAAPHIRYEPLQRARVTIEAAVTLDRVTVIKADHSAAARVVPIINTINNINISKADTWFGKGIDTNISVDHLDEDIMVGSISDYGLLSYILLLLFIYTCCMKFWSLESLIFLTLMSANLGNVAYGWGIMMLFTTVRYFKSYEYNT